MGRFLVLGLLAPLAMACASASPMSETGREGAGKPSVTRLLMAVDPLTQGETNELRHMSSPSVWPFRSVYEYPIALDAKTGKLIPGLATQWGLEPDGMSYRLKLRGAAPFHSGQWGSFGGQDLVYMWKDITLEDSLHGQANYWRDVVRDVEVVNDQEVVYRLKKPDGQFLLALSETQGGAEVRSKRQFDAAGNPTSIDKGAHAGTGPYQYKAREIGTRVVLERAPGSHWSGVVPDFPEFEFRFIKEPSTRLAALLTGEVHMAALPQDLISEADQRGMKIRKGVFPGVRIFGQILCCYFNQEPGKPESGWRYPDSPLMDLRVRKALNQAINRDELNKAFFAGKGELMYVNHFHSSRDGWDPGWERRFKDEYGFDQAKARSLLAEAGYGPGKPLRTTMLVVPVTGIAGGPDIAEAIASYWRAAGINVDLATIEPSEVDARNRAYGFSNHIRLFGTGANQWTGVSVMNSSYGRGSGVRDTTAEAVLQQLTNTMDESKREPLWRQVGEALFAGQTNINLFWLPAEAVVNPSVVGEWVYPGSITGTWTHLHNIKAAR